MNVNINTSFIFRAFMLGGVFATSGALAKEGVSSPVNIDSKEIREKFCEATFKKNIDEVTTEVNISASNFAEHEIINAQLITIDAQIDLLEKKSIVRKSIKESRLSTFERR